jgi:hypothetical protein
MKLVLTLIRLDLVESKKLELQMLKLRKWDFFELKNSDLRE